MTKSDLLTIFFEAIAMGGFTVGVMDWLKGVNILLEFVILLLGLATGWIAFWRTVKGRKKKG